jgi:uncharacterized RDD family membrane protein YckC
MGEGAEQNPFAPPAEHADRELGQEVSGNWNLATYGQRFAGSFIDGLLYSVTGIPGLIAFISVYSKELTSGADHMPATLALVFIGPLLLAIYQWSLVARTGQTIAKRWLRMRIVREETGTPPGFVNGVLLRSWLFVAAGMLPVAGGCLGLADPIAIFFGNRRQTLHDRVARTLVIQE